MERACSGLTFDYSNANTALDLMKISEIATAFYHNSPEHNFQQLRTLISGDNRKTMAVSGEDEAANSVIGDILEAETLPEIMNYVLKRFPGRTAVLLGDRAQLESWRAAIRTVDFETIEWDWNISLKEREELLDKTIVLCRVAVRPEEWETISELKQTHGERLVTITELLLPFTNIAFLQKRLNYFVSSFDAIIRYYFGLTDFTPFAKLEQAYSLKDRRVIEFGPFDGCQTAGIVNYGARSVDCIEARAENSAKTMAAAHALGWRNVRVLMDDFHNVDAVRYGTYDLAFAHGVYYHSIAPFLFLRNLMSLSDNIFLGGFCATETRPDVPYTLLNYEGQSYKAKKYVEGNSFVSGVNPYGYIFDKDDLIRFFSERDYKVTVISEHAVPNARTYTQGGIFLRFLAQKI